ncbi:protein NRT1/ PTR FAMILY 4.5-like [Tripterygium wilfordii]|uniref:protein NRT1/ PTR FAMILY 4.5-like n=1 Tax=Tripterygium wilfordii TaxID=458696 RepID=UPI0018F82C11|nr:protein NRT1/ PTR FAMILY 4.5-like [Tripterygium wilfordii]
MSESNKSTLFGLVSARETNHVRCHMIPFCFSMQFVYVLAVCTEKEKNIHRMGIFRDDQTRSKRETKLGGNRAALFVYATEGLENMAFISNAVSLVTYFYGYMNFSLTKSATTLTNFMGTAFILALFGGFISDTYLSRFKTCVLFGIVELLGYGLLAVQAHFHQLRPIPCKGAAPSLANQCEPANSSQSAILFTGLYLVAFGTSGIKAALPSLGADQFDEKDPKEAAKLSSFFNWFLFSLTIGAIIGVTFIVWISTNEGWEWSFGICTIALLFAIIFVCMGKSLYRNNVPNGSPLIRILQVFVAAIRNRKLPIPEKAEELHEIHDKEADLQSEILERTDQFRFLDRAAIVSNSAEVATSNNTGRWSLCTVTQVEEAKILIRMLPIILSTVFMNTCLAQLQTFSIQQSNTMDRHILGFEVPGASIPVIPLLFMFIMIPLYERVFIPFARKITGIPTGIRLLQRVGIGLVLSAISMAVAGIVETRRKHVAIEHNMVDSNEPLPISVFWLGFQYAIFGAADMFTLVGLLEFFYAESSAGMKSLSTAISWCSLAFGYFLSSVIVEVVNKVSGGWLASNNLNRDKLNYFYWLLALLSIANFGFYLVCASWYRYKKVGVKQVKDSVSADVKGKMEMTRV